MPLPPCLTAGALFASTPTVATVAGVPVDQLRGRGASVPFIEYEAENGCFNGHLLGPSRTLHSIAAEASGRRAVRLEGQGQFVEFTLARPANAVIVRYAIPDSPDGAGIDATLGIYVAGERIGSLAVTSRYGWFYGRYPFTNRPSDGGARHMFDEARLLLGRMLAAGTRVRIAVGPRDLAPWYVVDLADFELVPPPRHRPQGSLSVADYGADPTGKRESSTAFIRAIATARRRRMALWVGPGTWRVNRRLAVDRVTITGAGPWYSVLRGGGVGLYGGRGSTGVRLAHFAIIGEVRERNDKVKLAGIGGAIGGGSSIEDLWLQHHKSGVWLDGPLSGITIRGLRILDNTADGINLRRGVRDARVENVFVRNSGDDGIALWSHHAADANDLIDHSTVVAPTLANGIALYGGRNIRLDHNLVADTLTEGGGIHVGNRFDAVPLSGKITITNNLLVRAGSFDPNWRFGVGALWFYALDGPISADVRISGTQIVDSTISAIQFIGKPIRTVRFSGTIVDGAADWLQVQSAGEAHFFGLKARRLDVSAYARCATDFVVSFDRLVAPPTEPSTKLCGKLDPRFVAHRLAQ